MRKSIRSKSHSRRLRLESLERRNLLAGDVTAALVAGDLVVFGDEFDNGFTVQPMSSSPDAAGTVGGGVLITPDATTRINGLDPGVPWRVDDVVSNVHIDARGGQDDVAVVGTEGVVLDNLVVDSGNGSDSLTLQDLHVTQRVHSVHRGGNDRLTVLRTTADGDLTVESLGALTVSAENIRTPYLSIKYQGLAGARSSVSVAESSLAVMTVVGGGAADVRVTGTQATDMFIKLDSSRDRTARSSVSLHDNDCDGVLDISTLGTTDVAVSSSRASDMFLKVDGSPNRTARSSVSVQDNDCDGVLDVSTRGTADVRVGGT
ncbi:MAG: hypothetical protein MUF25_13585, partial [Pirellulaceae bacterium]|nr:hypothetical protein [Pirellulaceae bacterium]